MRLFKKKEPTNQQPQQQNDELDQVWLSVGQLDSDVLAPAINPAFMSNLPKWPSLDYAFKVTHLPNGGSIISTAGLSSSFDDRHPLKSRVSNPASGFGLELYLMSDEDVTVAEGANSWQLSVLLQLSYNCAYSGDFAQKLEQYGVLSMDVYDTKVNKELHTGETICVLMGAQSKTVPSTVKTARGNVRLVSVMLVRPENREKAINQAARSSYAQELADSFGGEPISNNS